MKTFKTKDAFGDDFQVEPGANVASFRAGGVYVTCCDGEGVAGCFLDQDRTRQLRDYLSRVIEQAPSDPSNEGRAPNATYLARREVMVQAKLEAGHFGSLQSNASMIAEVDALLSAIDETPVPEWAGGEHE